MLPLKIGIYFSINAPLLKYRLLKEIPLSPNVFLAGSSVLVLAITVTSTSFPYTISYAVTSERYALL